MSKPLTAEQLEQHRIDVSSARTEHAEDDIMLSTVGQQGALLATIADLERQLTETQDQRDKIVEGNLRIVRRNLDLEAATAAAIGRGVELWRLAEVYREDRDDWAAELAESEVTQARAELRATAFQRWFEAAVKQHNMDVVTQARYREALGELLAYINDMSKRMAGQPKGLLPDKRIGKARAALGQQERRG